MPDSTPRSRALWAGWITAGLALLIAAVAGVYAAYQRNLLTDVELRLVDAVTKLQMSEARVTATAAESNAIRTNLAVLSAPDALDMKLVGRGATPDATGRVFLSRAKGVLFSATKLKPLPDGQEYQIWLLPHGAPVNVGTVRAPDDGYVTAAFDAPANTPAPSGFSVSIEPEGGSPAPTGAVALATP